MLELRIPRALLEWLDDNRGEMSRSAFIIHTLVIHMNESKIKS